MERGPESPARYFPEDSLFDSTPDDIFFWERFSFIQYPGDIALGLGPNWPRTRNPEWVDQHTEDYYYEMD